MTLALAAVGARSSAFVLHFNLRRAAGVKISSSSHFAVSEAAELSSDVKGEQLRLQRLWYRRSRGDDDVDSWGTEPVNTVIRGFDLRGSQPRTSYSNSDEEEDDAVAHLLRMIGEDPAADDEDSNSDVYEYI
jgi:hypothetical protein